MRSIMVFFADSGAIKHMCDQRHFFNTFTAIGAGKWVVAGKIKWLYYHSLLVLLIELVNPITGIGETKLEVLGNGNIKILTEINQVMIPKMLTEVLYVPGLEINLSSIGAATANGLDVHFHDNEVTFTHHEEVVIAGKRKENALYQLNIKPMVNRIKTNTAYATHDMALRTDLRATFKVWHQRLGHLSYHTILKMIKRELVIELNVDGDCTIPESLCAEYQLRKFRLPFINGDDS